MIGNWKKCLNCEESKTAEDPIEIYAREQSFKIAQRIDAKCALLIKPRPKYCPKWLYEKIINDSVEMVKVV